MQSEDGEPTNITTNDDEPAAPDTSNIPSISTPTLPPQPPTSFSSSLPDPNAAIRAASQLPPVPYTPDPNPGGFVPYEPSNNNLPVPSYRDVSSDSIAQLTPDQISKAQKYCKWASSALNYDDVKTAITNLRNALELLQTGRDPA